MAHNPQGVNTITPKRDVMLSLKKKNIASASCCKSDPFHSLNYRCGKYWGQRERDSCVWKLKPALGASPSTLPSTVLAYVKKNHNRHKTMISIQKLIGKYATMSFLNTIFCHCFPNMKTWAVSQLYSCLIQLLHYTHLLDHYSKQMLSLSE